MTSDAKYVLYTFMSSAPLTAESGADPAPNTQGGNGCGRLLGLVRRIVDYGRDLMATLQRQNTPTPSSDVARRFGTWNLTLIIARIAHGLRLAAALEARLVRRPPVQEKPHNSNPDRPTAPVRPKLVGPRPARPRPARPEVTTQPDDTSALPHALPTVEEIAALIRGRPPGAVIVEICRDLGINATHPLWPEIRDAIIQYNGSLALMLKAWLRWSPDYLANPPDDLPIPDWPDWDDSFVASTGPP